MNQKKYHRLELTVCKICPTDIVRTSGGGGTGLELYDVLAFDQAWESY